MTTPTANPSQQDPLPNGILDFTGAFMRALNTARLYASGHDIFKKHIQQLYAGLNEAIADRDFLFIGCARDTLFLEGSFYEVKDANLQKFLKFFHSMGISHILFDKEITTEELESFIALLAGAQQGQGSEISSALPRENIKCVTLGLLDYSVFSTVQTVATQLAQTSEDEAVWRQLILQPAAAGTISVSPEKVKELTRLSKDVEELKKLLKQLDTDMVERQEGISTTHRGILLGNFIQNLGDTLAGIAPEEKTRFARQIGVVLDSLEPQLKTQILGAAAPDADRMEDGDVIHEIFQTIPDTQLLYLLLDALKETGANSLCFNNLFNRSMAKYKEPALLLTLIHQEIDRATREKESGTLSHWQHLEQLVVRQQETDELNKQYQKEIKALATSIQLQAPMVEEEEMARLLKTLTPESLRTEKAHLIIDLISQPCTPQKEALLPPMIENLGEILGPLLNQKNFPTVGNVLREVFLALSDYPQEAPVRKIMSSLFNTGEIRELMKNLLKQCSTYEPLETTAINAISQLYPEKTGSFLLDILVELKNDDSPQARWIMTTLAGLGPKLTVILGRRLQGASDLAIPRLLTLAAISKDTNLASSVEHLLEHQDHEIRLKAISALGQLKAERVVPRLAQILSQRSWVKTKKMKSLQMSAAHALAEIGTNEARKALQEAVDKGSGDLRALCEKLL